MLIHHGNAKLQAQYWCIAQRGQDADGRENSAVNSNTRSVCARAGSTPSAERKAAGASPRNEALPEQPASSALNLSPLLFQTRLVEEEESSAKPCDGKHPGQSRTTSSQISL